MFSEHPEVAAVLPNRAKELHTTHSWEFMHLEKNGKIPPSSPWRKANFGKDIILANLDTGKFYKKTYFSFTIWFIYLFLNEDLGNRLLKVLLNWIGVWPESKSFGEQGIVGPIPSKWKGGCTDKSTDGVRCNR